MPLRKEKYNVENPKDVEELLNYLQEISSDDEEYSLIENSANIDIVLMPPTDGADSDLDDAASDDEGTATVADIGKGVLKQTGELIATDKEGETCEVELSPEAIRRNAVDNNWSDDDDLPLSLLRSPRIMENKNSKRKRKWVPSELSSRQCAASINISTKPNIVDQILSDGMQPIDLFKLFFPEDFMKMVCDESVKYAIFKGNHSFTVSVPEMYKYFGILLLSGYCKVPFRRMYWETSADTYNHLVSNSMSRDRFEGILRYLHFNDNNSINLADKMYKVAPLIDQINNISQQLANPLGTSFSLDEAMEPYYGHHNLKQFIRGKPIRYGFKFWCLALSEGYVLKFDPYCGAGSKAPGKSLGSSVTEKLCLDYLPQGSTVFIDNFFNSLPLLSVLKYNHINCIGTLRSDRIEKAPLNDLKKSPRGSIHALHDTIEGITLIRWNDNNQVTIGTNIENKELCLSKGFCKRWSKSRRAFIQVDQPTLINLYNKGMGGVDLFDKQRALYRIRIRSRKWYWPIIRFCLNGAMINMWILYRYAFPKISLLQFTKRVVLALLTSPPHLAGPKPKCTRGVLTEVRYDRIDHIVDRQSTQRRCAHCGKCTMFHCLKCNVGLHPQTCFRAYHCPPQ